MKMSEYETIGVMQALLEIVQGRKEIVDVFMPLLYLMNRNMIEMEQEMLFKEIKIKLTARCRTFLVARE